MPANIFSFNEEFALGILEGLLDSDGTVYNSSIYYRLSSRAGILQVSALLKYFGYSVKNTYQQVPFGQNASYKTNYSVWGVSTTYKSNLPALINSFKFKNVNVCNNALRYKSNGETTIFSVTKLDSNDSFVSLQNEFIYDITTESHTFALNNILVHNCVSATMYPFLIDGIKGLGGLSASPKNLKSFCGIFCNMVFALSSQFAGAVACSEALLYFTYFCKKEWGPDFYQRANDVVETTYDGKQRTILQEIQQYWQQIIYTINQPAAARGFQSAFVNFSYFDKSFFEGMFGEFYFPDGSQPDWESLKWIQMEFMKWFNAERLRTVLTFPVETVTLLYKDGKFLDEEMFKFVCDEYARGHSFFTYISDSVDSLSSCCFKGNEIIKIYDKFGNGKSLSIEEFVNMNNNSINNNGNKTLKDDYYIYSYNEDGTKEKVKVIGTLKKECNDSLYEIKAGGTTITVTGDHIIMVKDLTDNTIKYIPAKYVHKSPDRYLVAVEE